MSHDDRDPAERIQQAVRDLRGTPAGQLLGDRQVRRRYAAEALLRNDDPILREVGRQLRDGTMRPSDVLRVPEYADAFGRAAEKAAAGLDPEQIADQLSELADRDAGRAS